MNAIAFHVFARTYFLNCSAVKLNEKFEQLGIKDIKGVTNFSFIFTYNESNVIKKVLFRQILPMVKRIPT